ncbi:class I SAM-dependent methyltransferase [Deinococcus altitudinis]|uniref:class I SAM-dependent methyltransferase n=1 Tax=Deinococcus altitudinis TaxID=468914 RepID=UPI0038912CBD
MTAEIGSEKSLRDYYRLRAQEYEGIYLRDDAQRQLEQLGLAAAVGRVCLNRDVLEIACGTGYWTQFADRVARHVTAIDTASSVLEIASSKDLRRTRFLAGDAYSPPEHEHGYSAGLALFWFSHVPRARHEEFLTAFHTRLEKGGRVLIGDNQDLPGVGGELSEADSGGDTFKTRRLADGTVHRVLKNYFSAAEITGLLSPFATELKVQSGTCFWWAEYTTRGDI